MPLKKKLLSKKPEAPVGSPQENNVPQALRIFAQFGVDIPKETNASGQYVCDCPLCGKAKHFFLTAESKKFKGEPAFTCKSCGLSGNKYTYLKAYYDLTLNSSTPGSYTRLGLKKKMRPEMFALGGVAFSPELHRWLLPTRTSQGGISNIHTYDGNNGSSPISAPGCTLHLLGLDEIKPTGPIYICEGHWDRMSLKWLLNECQKQPENYTVLAAPGSGTFPESDLQYLTGRDVYLLYDNDQSGYQGMQSAVKKLMGKALTIHVIEWPPNRFPDKFDISDFVRTTDLRPDASFQEILSWCHQAEAGVAAAGVEIIPKLKRDTIEEVIQDFKETGIHMYPGLRDALIVTLAVVESIKFKGEPLWMYLIGVSGAGKSLALEATLASSEVLYRTAITHRSLLSGFNGEDDPSLLAKLPGRSLVVKDYSNVLALPHYEQDLLFSILREAYDGRVYRDYGNGVIRQYPPPDSPYEDCRFSFVAGVTPEIYARNNSALGERFLRFHIPRTGADDLRAIETVMDDSWRTHQQSKRRAAAVAGFLGRNGDTPFDQIKPPSMPEWYKKRLISLAQFVGYCRSHVSRTKDDLDYDPAVESGTRMAKQLLKLSYSICRIMGKTTCDKDVYRLVRKVAWDTAHGWRRSIYKAIYTQGEGECDAISRLTGFSRTTVFRQLRDMHALGLLKKGPTTRPRPDIGRSKQTYLLSARAQEIYEVAQIQEM